MKQLLSGRINALGLGTPILLMTMLAMMVLPLPAFLLDLLFTFNIALSLIVLLAAVYAGRPLEFAVFPTVLLISTLLRLGMNVASTRVVLINGHTGTDAAGKVIEAFGEFVIGGNYTVGFVIFAILVIINFVVVTKGAGRISEVNARFTLDAMPGKQMAIDADLNAGIINQDEARARREDVAQEADFYGAMDGASKFVRGDAVAGILILLINMIGGLAVGMGQHGLSFEQAGHNYVLLTIGDGLVAQIPSLLLSTAAAIIVTRVSSTQDMGQQMSSQLFGSPKALGITAGIVLVLGMIPGMPNFVFLSIGGGLGYMAWRMSRKPKAELVDENKEQQQEEKSSEPRELSWDDVQPVDMIGLEVGYRMIALVDKTQGGELLTRIKGVRKKLSQELGFLVPSVHIRDNLDLSPSSYRITLLDVPVGEGEVHPGKEMAINPGQVFGTLNGISGIDPAFGLEAVWIEPSQRDEAQTMGYTVVDCSTVVATHLSQLLKQHANELLGHDEVQQLLDVLGKSSPKLVENLVPKTVSLGVVLKVMQNLLEEGIPIRDVRSIAEALAEHAPKSQEPDALTAAVRVALGRTIYQNIAGMESELGVMTLDPELEQMLHNSLQGAAGVGGLEPGLAETMMRQVAEEARRQEAAGQTPVLLVSSPLRLWLAKLIRGTTPNLNVLAYDEIPASKRVKVTASIGKQPVALAG
ncbi:flagellar biosynthesis protein FlhA [Porticoccaceae bacterium LTM1]|nr:flagellar biosynthesis protein FlhA [Porticoccaceae bacterium LTM1]